LSGESHASSMPAADKSRRPHVREAIADVEAGVELGQPPSHP
jgi:hypothetical protein